MENRDKLLEAVLKSEEIEINGYKYIVKEMTTIEGSKYDGSLYEIVNGTPKYNKDGVKAKLVQICLYDTKDNRMFKKSDMGLIEQLPKSIVEKIYGVAQRLNKTDVEEAEKN